MSQEAQLSANRIEDIYQAAFRKVLKIEYRDVARTPAQTIKYRLRWTAGESGSAAFCEPYRRYLPSCI